MHVFGCKWVENNNGVKVDDHGFIKVDFNRVGYRDEPFILPSQARQVFYVTDPANEKWSIVILNDHNNKECENTCVGDDPFINISEATENVPTVDDILYMRKDHDEGILIDPSI